jgi:hypothetical protein
MVGRGGVEPPTSRLSGVRSNHLSYRPARRFRLKGRNATFQWKDASRSAERRKPRGPRLVSLSSTRAALERPSIRASRPVLLCCFRSFASKAAGGACRARGAPKEGLTRGEQAGSIGAARSGEAGFGGAYRDRTDDLLNAIQSLSQLS